MHFYGIGESAGHKTLDGLYKAFTSKGVPVVLTEYGLNSEGYKYFDNTDAAVNRMTDFASYARARGMSVVFWDNNAGSKGVKGHKLIDRATAKVVCPEIVKAFTTANKPALASDAKTSSAGTSSSTGTSYIKAKASVTKNTVKLSDFIEALKSYDGTDKLFSGKKFDKNWRRIWNTNELNNAIDFFFDIQKKDLQKISV